MKWDEKEHNQERCTYRDELIEDCCHVLYEQEKKTRGVEFKKKPATI